MSDVNDEIINDMKNYDYVKYKKFLNNKTYLNNEKNINDIFNIYNNIKDEKMKIYYNNIIINILHYNIEKDIENDKILINIFEQEYKDKILFINKFYGENYNYTNFYNKMKFYNKKIPFNTEVLSNNILINNKYNYTNIYYLKYKNIYDIDNIYKLNSFYYKDNLFNYYNNKNDVNIIDLYIQNNIKNDILEIHSKCFSKDIIYNNNFKYIYEDKKKKFYILIKYNSNNNIIYDINYDNNLIFYLLLEYKETLFYIFDKEKKQKYTILNKNSLKNLNDELIYIDSYLNFNYDIIRNNFKKLCSIHLYINKILHTNKDTIIKNNLMAIEKYIKKKNNYTITNGNIYYNKNVLPCICKYNFFIFLLHDYIFIRNNNSYDKDNFLYFYYIYIKKFFTEIERDIINKKKYYNDIKITDYKLYKFTTHFCKITIFNCMYYYTLINNTEIQEYLNKIDINNLKISEQYNNFVIKYNINNEIFLLKDFKDYFLKPTYLIYIIKNSVDFTIKKYYDDNEILLNKKKTLIKKLNYYNEIIRFFNNLNKIKNINVFFEIYKNFNKQIINTLNNEIVNKYIIESNYNIKKDNNETIVNDNFYNKSITLKNYINKLYNIFLYFYLLSQIINVLLNKINKILEKFINEDININTINEDINTIYKDINTIYKLYEDFMNIFNENNNNTDEKFILNKNILKDKKSALTNLNTKLSTFHEDPKLSYLKDYKIKNKYKKMINEIYISLFFDKGMYEIRNDEKNDNLLDFKFEFLYQIYKNDINLNFLTDKIENFNLNFKKENNNLKNIDYEKLIDANEVKIKKIDKIFIDIKNRYNTKYFYINDLYDNKNKVKLQQFYDYIYVLNHTKFKLNFNNDIIKKKILNDDIVIENQKNINNTDFFNKYFNNLKIELLYNNEINFEKFENVSNKINKFENMIDANIILNTNKIQINN